MLKQSMFALASAAAVGVGFATSAEASGFSGSYDPVNWTLTNDNANGFVDTSSAPSEISVTGGDNGSGFFGQTSYTTTAAADGLVSFDWTYNTTDVDGPSFDPFGFLLNGSFFQLTDDTGADFQSGFADFSVVEGDEFGFAIQTVDNFFGPATATVSDFEAPESVPEPTSTLALLAVGTVTAAGALKQRQSA